MQELVIGKGCRHGGDVALSSWTKSFYAVSAWEPLEMMILTPGRRQDGRVAVAVYDQLGRWYDEAAGTGSSCHCDVFSLGA
jgi:hypothetical protein